MDQNNKPQELTAIAFEDIPTPEEHRREVRKIFLVCGSTAASIVILSALSVFVALVRGVPLQTIALVVPIVMGIGISTFAIGYGIPVGLVSLKRLEIAYRMGYVGLGMNRKAAGAMETIAKKIERETAPVLMKQRQATEA